MFTMGLFGILNGKYPEYARLINRSGLHLLRKTTASGCLTILAPLLECVSAAHRTA
jgi:hypothetical protein